MREGFSILELVMALAVIGILAAISLSAVRPSAGLPLRLLKLQVEHCQLMAQTLNKETTLKVFSNHTKGCGRELRLEVIESRFGLNRNYPTFQANGETSPGRITLRLKGGKVCSLVISRTGLTRNEC